MMQQVNLYTKELKPKRETVSAGRSLIAVLLAVFAMVSFTVWQQSTMAQEQHAVQALELQHEQLLARANLLRYSPEGTGPDKGPQQLLDLQSAVANRERLVQLVTGRRLGNDQGFSPYLMALDAIKPEQTHITVLRIQRGGASAVLEGHSKQLAEIPALYDSLLSTAVFSATDLGGLDISRQGTVHRFVINAKALPDDGGTAP